VWTWVVFVEVVIEHDFGNAPHARALPIANQMSQFFPSSENHTFGKCSIPSNKFLESVDGYKIECT
jgi:hypothetical protein